MVSDSIGSGKLRFMPKCGLAHLTTVRHHLWAKAYEALTVTILKILASFFALFEARAMSGRGGSSVQS
ncbi:hypothetical protein K470DRAFT_261057 [Piedraia hortae CBS 480.64]|uniref:Uncharacterized protein n=1 Tax=Piedraia hortae CBS 480.64 TaxID=1314780 RepID=A0A6A7BRN5_9PEZI|nr:hypothetical protein K470DRAFT_261057 [Piedraia hortae CBS 480.64]